MEKKVKEAIRYLGYGKTPADEHTLQVIEECFQTLSRTDRAKTIYRVFELEFTDDDTIGIGNFYIKSQSLKRNLDGCKRAVLLVTTLGLEPDRLLQYYEVADIAKALIFQACAAAYLEEYTDLMQDNIAQELGLEKIDFKPRFSPGYGDFDIAHQRDILGLLEAAKNVGVTMTENYLLIPTKSITAVIGISH